MAYAPGNDSSPVYSILTSREFTGPGVTHNAYPHLPAARGNYDGLRHRKGENSVGYYVTQYHQS
jgi:hypothetical protein